MRPFVCRFRSAALAAAAVACACDDPTRPREVPLLSSLVAFVLLDPDRPTQVAFVQQSAESGPVDLWGEVASNGSIVARGSAPAPANETAVADELEACRYRYGGVGVDPAHDEPPAPGQPPWLARCLSLPFEPALGETYTVALAGSERPTVHGTTDVPADFGIVSYVIDSTEHGMSLRAEWTRSRGVRAYMVDLLAVGDPRFGIHPPPEPLTPPCVVDQTCHGFFAITEETAINVPIDARFYGGHGPFQLLVSGLNDDVYGYLLTGATSKYFPVPPAQNVVAGRGMVGAWVRRSVVDVLGLEIKRTGAGLLLTNRLDQPLHVALNAPPIRSVSDVTCDPLALDVFRRGRCVDLQGGQSVSLRYADIPLYDSFTRGFSLSIRGFPGRTSPVLFWVPFT
jgi:hypothetical protein